MSANPATTRSHDSLRRTLAAVLPQSHRFTIHHLSTPPAKCDALFSAPPNERPDKTFCEKHFLTVSIDSQRTTPEALTPEKVIILGIEIMIYTTAHSSTLFVSKADSTGYLGLIKLPKGTPSPIREVCAAFIEYLVESRRRKQIQFVVSLFARAQNQYLFPASVDNPGKHVLDDRGLIKWWCRVLNPLLETSNQKHSDVKGYLVIPGLDDYETKAFIPRTPAASSWLLRHPLKEISHYTREFDWVPPRCLIPKFPDDPKSRFRDELDEESAKSGEMRVSGNWKSVKNLDTFWEMMAFRNECSSGRMTGFIWLVIDSEDSKKEDVATNLATPSASAPEDLQHAQPETPKTSRIVHTQLTPSSTPRRLFRSRIETTQLEKDEVRKNKGSKKTKKTKLRGPIIPRKPRIKTSQRNNLGDRPVSTGYYYWPTEGRGERLVRDADYQRIVDLLLHLDFETLDKATTSTKRWVKETGMGGAWGWDVLGTREVKPADATVAAGANITNNLNGLVKRKRVEETAEKVGEKGVNVLSAGLVKRKPKDLPASADGETQQEVKVLGAGLVRKKPKN